MLDGVPAAWKVPLFNNSVRETSLLALTWMDAAGTSSSNKTRLVDADHAAERSVRLEISFPDAASNSAMRLPVDSAYRAAINRPSGEGVSSPHSLPARCGVNR